MSELDRATVILERMQALAMLLQESGSITGTQAGDLLEMLIAGCRAEMSGGDGGRAGITPARGESRCPGPLRHKGTC